jgi:hypothetical protein
MAAASSRPGAPAPTEPMPAAAARRTSPPSRWGVLLVAALALLGVQGIARPGGVQQVVVAALAGVAVLLALRAADVDRRLVRAVAVLAVAVVAVSCVRAATGVVGDGAARLANAALVALGPPAVALGVVRDLRSTGEVRLEAVMGVLCLYLLLGMFFSFGYGAIDRLGGEPFFASGVEATPARCLYFSFTTLTTVGYGDLVARSNLGHTLAVFEALIGQIYLVTVVSLIGSNLGHPARRRA